jgi:hypothetical protein
MAGAPPIPELDKAHCYSHPFIQMPLMPMHSLLTSKLPNSPSPQKVGRSPASPHMAVLAISSALHHYCASACHAPWRAQSQAAAAAPASALLHRQERHGLAFLPAQHVGCLGRLVGKADLIAVGAPALVEGVVEVAIGAVQILVPALQRCQGLGELEDMGRLCIL